MDHRRHARERPCARLHLPRAWYTEDGSAFRALAHWQSRDAARAFFGEWEIEAEPGETATVLVGDVGLVPLGGGP